MKISDAIEDFLFSIDKYRKRFWKNTEFFFKMCGNPVRESKS